MADLSGSTGARARFALVNVVGGLAVLGGCCGTYDRHVAAIDAAVPRRGA